MLGMHLKSFTDKNTVLILGIWHTFVGVPAASGGPSLFSHITKGPKLLCYATGTNFVSFCEEVYI